MPWLDGEAMCSQHKTVRWLYEINALCITQSSQIYCCVIDPKAENLAATNAAVSGSSICIAMIVPDFNVIVWGIQMQKKTLIDIGKWSCYCVRD